MFLNGDIKRLRTQAQPYNSPRHARPPRPLATPESYPLARATAIAAAEFTGAQGWALNATLGELADIDGVRWGDHPSDSVVPVSPGGVVDRLPEPESGRAILVHWVGHAPPTVLVIRPAPAVGAAINGGEFSLMAGATKAWHVMPAE